MLPTPDIVDKFKLNPVSNTIRAPHLAPPCHARPIHGLWSLASGTNHPAPCNPRIPTPPPSEEGPSSPSGASTPSSPVDDKRHHDLTPDAPEGKCRRFFVTEDFRHRLVDWLSGHYQAREKFVFENKAPFTGSSESLAKTFLESLPGPSRPNTRTVFNQVKLIKDMYTSTVAHESEGKHAERPPWFDTWHAMVECGSCPPSWEDEDQARLRKRRRSEDEETVIRPSSPSEAKRARATSSSLDDPPLGARVESLLTWAKEVENLPVRTPSDTLAVLKALGAMEQAQLRVLEEVRSLRRAILARR